MKSLADLIPDPTTLIELEPEELAGVLLEHLNSLPHNEQRNQLHPNNLVEFGLRGYASQHRDALGQAVMEAWAWLQRECFIAPRPGDTGGWMFVTRRGQRVKSAMDLRALRKADMLPKELLHPVIDAKAALPFMRGEYDTAVFQAFKEVEVAVRRQSNFDDTDLGTALMRQAFKPKDGPLSDLRTPIAEREATAHIFAGAIGLYKNPHSHRNVPLTDPAEAAALIIMASHFLFLVEARPTNS